MSMTDAGDVDAYDRLTRDGHIQRTDPSVGREAHNVEAECDTAVADQKQQVPPPRQSSTTLSDSGTQPGELARVVCVTDTLDEC